VSTRSLLTFKDPFCEPVVVDTGGKIYEAVPCGCPGVECPNSNAFTPYKPLAPIAVALIATVLIIAFVRHRARKRDATSHGS
jgi:hypothetical protein